MNIKYDIDILNQKSVHHANAAQNTKPFQHETSQKDWIYKLLLLIIQVENIRRY